jgi:hypothetical protein
MEGRSLGHTPDSSSSISSSSGSSSSSGGISQGVSMSG